MGFSKELCQYAIKNNALLEGGVTEAAQQVVFKAVNAYLKKRIEGIGGWKGTFELAIGEADDTYFAPAAWPESQDGRYRAMYKLTETGDQNSFWLSSALGVNGVKLCLQFWCHGALGGRAKSEIGRKLLTLANTAAVKEAGMAQGGEENVLSLPFVLNAETLAAEYPTVDKALAPLDAALDRLLKVHPLIDAAVQELTAKK